jgi:hypothetical protein
MSQKQTWSIEGPMSASTAGLFGYADGCEWGVSHFRMTKV